MMSYQHIPAAPHPRTYAPDEITLYGVKLNVTTAVPATTNVAYLPFQDRRLRLSIVPVNADSPADPNIVIGIIYGYAFEGGCYRCDSPKLLMFHPRTAETPAVGCGFGVGYQMWQLPKKTPIMELSTNFDLAEELVLNAHLPGNRNPNTYGNNMMLAHRSGRLNRNIT
jgi:hypothetical protein